MVRCRATPASPWCCVKPDGFGKAIGRKSTGRTMRLQLRTWPEVEDYLKTSRGIILRIGSTEQHGPNGLIGTDAICDEEIPLGAGKATGALVGATIGVGMAAHHMEFPGTMTLSPSTLMLVIRDYV